MTFSASLSFFLFAGWIEFGKAFWLIDLPLSSILCTVLSNCHSELPRKGRIEYSRSEITKLNHGFKTGISKDIQLKINIKCIAPFADKPPFSTHVGPPYTSVISSIISEVAHSLRPACVPDPPPITWWYNRRPSDLEMFYGHDRPASLTPTSWKTSQLRHCRYKLVYCKLCTTSHYATKILWTLKGKQVNRLTRWGLPLLSANRFGLLRLVQCVYTNLMCQID